MPTNNSTAKRDRQSQKRRMKNKEAKSRVRTVTKSFESSVKAGNKEEAVEKFKVFTKTIDTATGKGIYHKNTAARKKSRMNRLLNSLNIENE